ncbi:hypothetical protein J6590_059517 [Homalodisca vitripennis]|nr:hypothetical protein J6590_059517 [Homalodisca vitripennis]
MKMSFSVNNVTPSIDDKLRHYDDDSISLSRGLAEDMQIPECSGQGALAVIPPVPAGNVIAAFQ